MHPFRFLSAVALSLVVFAVAAVAVDSPPNEPVAAAPTADRVFVEPSPTTTAPDYSRLVGAGTVGVLHDSELELTEEAMARSTTSTTSTSTSTTTTTPSPTPNNTTPPQTETKDTPEPQTGGFDSSAESQFASSINSYRSSNGASALTRDASLDGYARWWAKELAEAQELSHSHIASLLDPWSAVGENVGVGPTVPAIFDALVASPGHRKNMLSDFTHVGVGVYEDSRGALWTAHVFTR